ncbi:hypothetical protein NC653_017319 [Populus alba x Populus x berolinensis]|uniref:Uncharacterized protein n=1 Tax=Populus alba x Populus x berolinensis TaxID=444605 RepID=A0AAD6W0C2_9ROSI|nr:hypothetical protein NC653_017319 [Populus alba x Populus x berolinensis]
MSRDVHSSGCACDVIMNASDLKLIQIKRKGTESFMFYTASTFFFDILQAMGYLHGNEVMETLGSIKPPVSTPEINYQRSYECNASEEIGSIWRKKRKTICGKQKKQNVKGRKGKVQQNISKTPGGPEAAEIGLLITIYVLLKLYKIKQRKNIGDHCFSP